MGWGLVLKDKTASATPKGWVPKWMRLKFNAECRNSVSVVSLLRIVEISVTILRPR